MLYEKSCGVILFKKTKEQYKFLIIRNKSGGVWGFPKGHVEKGETEQETALRELYEEVGLKAELRDNFREFITYNSTPETKKRVVYFLGKPLTNKIKYILDEVDMYKWATFDYAFNIFQFAEIKKLLTKANKFLLKNNF